MWKVERDKPRMLMGQKVASVIVRLQQEVKAGMKTLNFACRLINSIV